MRLRRSSMDGIEAAEAAEAAPAIILVQNPIALAAPGAEQSGSDLPVAQVLRTVLPVVAVTAVMPDDVAATTSTKPKVRRRRRSRTSNPAEELAAEAPPAAAVQPRTGREVIVQVQNPVTVGNCNCAGAYQSLHRFGVRVDMTWRPSKCATGGPAAPLLRPSPSLLRLPAVPRPRLCVACTWGMGACASWCCVDTDCGALCDAPCTLSSFLSEVVVDRQLETYVCMLPFARICCLHYYACVCNQNHPLQQCLLTLISLKGVSSDRNHFMRVSTYFWQQSCSFASVAVQRNWFSDQV